MVKVCAISYINTVPFVYGIKHIESKLCVDVLLQTPSKCAKHIENGDCDIAIVPVATLPQLNSVKIVSNYSISATARVKTVELLSNTPLNEIKRVFLDEDSRTSAMLVRILCKELWNISPEFLDIKYIDNTITPKSGEGYLMIGDKVFQMAHKFKYNHDLASAWYELTSLPFVFAVWVARNEVQEEYIESLNSALKYGTEHIEEAINECVDSVDKQVASDYLTNYIEYSLNRDKIKAIELFLNKAALLKSKEFSSPQ